MIKQVHGTILQMSSLKQIKHKWFDRRFVLRAARGCSLRTGCRHSGGCGLRAGSSRDRRSYFALRGHGNCRSKPCFVVCFKRQQKRYSNAPSDICIRNDQSVRMRMSCSSRYLWAQQELLCSVKWCMHRNPCRNNAWRDLIGVCRRLQIANNFW